MLSRVGLSSWLQKEYVPDALTLEFHVACYHLGWWVYKNHEACHVTHPTSLLMLKKEHAMWLHHHCGCKYTRVFIVWVQTQIAAFPALQVRNAMPWENPCLGFQGVYGRCISCGFWALVSHDWVEGKRKLSFSADNVCSDSKARKGPI